jgi:hypothetical protein
MKTLLTLIFLSLTVFAQSGRVEVISDSLKMRVDSTGSPAGDTTYVRDFKANYRWVYISYTDTGSVYTDTVYIYASAGTDTTTWVRVPVYDPIEDVTTSAIVNVNDTKMYLIYIPRPNWIKLLLANSGGGRISGRMGRFVIRALNENY